MSKQKKQENRKPYPVAVWLMSVPCEEDELIVLRALAHLTGDFETAFQIALGCSTPYKGPVGGPVSLETATVIVKWLESVGGHAIIDDDMYLDDCEAVETWRRSTMTI